MKLLFNALALSALASACQAPANLRDTSTAGASLGATARDPDAIAIHGGYSEVLQDELRDFAPFGFEYRFGYRDSFPYPWKNLRPQAGVTILNEGSVYAYAGLRYDWDFHPRLRISPNFSAGYFEEGDGPTLQLGYPLEFRSAIEFSTPLAARWRLGVALDHISNAGFGSSNPGTETLLFSLAYEL